MIGQLLARRYQIIRVLGAGAFGQTYVARDTHIPGNPTCVVKHLKPANNSSKLLETARQLFKREAETLVKLGSHDQIPQLFAYFEEDDEFYLVQEYIEGHTLAAQLPAGKRLPESQVIQLLEEVLSILKFVHSQGVIHRDIKPDNIVRRESDNKLVLIDFGAIKQVQSQHFSGEGQEQTVIASTRIGTPGYTPTEQDRGKSRPSSDIYALGMVGIQSLTGIYPQHLLEDDETGEIIWQHQAQVSSELAAILTKMVRYHFKDRYQSAAEALYALQSLKNSSISTVSVTVDNVDNKVTPNLSQSVSRKLIEPAVVDNVDNNVTPSVHELLFRWVQRGKIEFRVIRENQPSKNPGTVRIGSDATLCDIVLSEPTVSGLHVEIFFNSLEKRFYLRSLQESNPPVVDGQPLPTGEMVLLQGSNVQLGELGLKVLAIDLKPLTATRYYMPSQKMAEQVTTVLQPNFPTVQQPIHQTVRQDTRVSSSSNQTLQPTKTQTTDFSFTSSKRLPLLMGLGVAALIGVGGSYAYLQRQFSSLAFKGTSTAKSNSTTKSKGTQVSTTKSGSTANPVKITAIAPPESRASLNIKDVAIASPESTASLDIKDVAIAPPKSRASLDLTDTLLVNFELTPNSDSTGSSIVNSDSTAKSSKTGTSRAKSGSTAQSDRTDTLTGKPDSTAWHSDKVLTLLEKARQKAKQGNFLGAIALAEEIPFDSSLYQQAEYEIVQWQRRQQEKLARQEAENQARELLANAIDVAKTGEVIDLETAIKLAQEAIAQAPPDSTVYKQAKNAIARWQNQAATQPKQQTNPQPEQQINPQPEQQINPQPEQQINLQPEQETKALFYACYCPPSDSNAQKPFTYTEAGRDLIALGGAAGATPQDRTNQCWNCSQL